MKARTRSRKKASRSVRVKSIAALSLALRFRQPIIALKRRRRGDKSMTDLAAFRKQTRAWLAANCPPAMRQPMRGEEDASSGGRDAAFKDEAQTLWMERMAERGWTVPACPKESGGGGL